MIIDKKTYKKIKKILIDKDLTESQLSREINIDKASVNRTIKGISKSKRVRSAIENYLGQKIWSFSPTTKKTSSLSYKSNRYIKENKEREDVFKTKIDKDSHNIVEWFIYKCTQRNIQYNWRTLVANKKTWRRKAMMLLQNHSPETISDAIDWIFNEDSYWHGKIFDFSVFFRNWNNITNEMQNQNQRPEKPENNKVEINTLFLKKLCIDELLKQMDEYKRKTKYYKDILEKLENTNK